MGILTIPFSLQIHAHSRKIITLSGFLFFLLLWIGILTTPDVVRAAPGDPPNLGPQSASLTEVAVSTMGNDQIAPRAAASGTSSGYLVAFEHVYTADDHDIYARHIGSDGFPAGSEFSVLSSGKSQTSPAVAFNSVHNEYLVVWEEAYSSTDHDIYARRISAAGAPIGDSFPVAQTTLPESEPSIAYNPTRDQYLLVFERKVGSDEFAQKDIIGSSLDAAGTIIGSPVSIAVGLYNEEHPSAACGNDRFLIAWQEHQPLTTDYGIYAQLVGGDGSLLGSEIGISTWENNQLLPRLAYSPDDGQFLAVWEDHHYSSPEGSYIYGQRFDNTGAMVGSSILISGGGGKDRLAPDVAYNSQVRSYEVIWENAYSSSDHDLYGRRVAYDGTQPEGEFPYIATGANQTGSTLVSGSGSTFLAIWEDTRNQATSGIDLYGSLASIDVPTISGHVYSGVHNETTSPLAGVSVKLNCSSDLGVLGSLAGSTVTDAQGAYLLPAYGLCEFYNVVETDPAGYISVNSSKSPDGFTYSSNWTYFTHPLVGKNLSGSNFWDILQPPTDTIPPDNWVNLSPSGWLNQMAPWMSIQVEDLYSGLNVGSAEFSYTINGGVGWTDWSPAACTGANSTISPQTISTVVHFGQESGLSALNRVRFRISDMAGNLGVSQEYPVNVDLTAPQNPTTMVCPSHPVSTWVASSQLSCQWSGASDALSGVGGYAVTWTQQPDTYPNPPASLDDTEAASGYLSDSGSWYFHLITIDRAGNPSADALHYGPMRVDTTGPTAWMTAPGGSTSDTLSLNVAWIGVDSGSGLASYDVEASPNGGAWRAWQTGVTSTSATYLGARGDTVAFRVRARDNVGNVGSWSSSTGQITFGVDVTVAVQDENLQKLPGAEVYLNGSLMGTTGVAGTLQLHEVVISDKLSPVTG